MHFVLAVSAVPPRVPFELRSALAASSDKLQPIALLCAFGAFYATVCSLLGLEDGAPETNASDITESVSGRAAHSGVAASDAGGDAASVASSATSLPARLAASARESVAAKVTLPLKQRLACRAVRRAQRARWLSHIPATRRSQDDFVRAAMGFTPEYLAHVKSAADHAVFVYILDEILLRDSVHEISTAVKQLVCYVLARSAENSVLTAHAAFLANRFGADDRQLASCMDSSFLTALHALYSSRGRGVEEIPASSASTSTTSSSARSPPHFPPPPFEMDTARKRCRTPSFGLVPCEDREHPSNVHARRGRGSDRRRGFPHLRREGREADGTRRAVDRNKAAEMLVGPDGPPRDEMLEIEPTTPVKILPDDVGGPSSRVAIERVHSAGNMPDLSIDSDDSDTLDGSMSSSSEPCAIRDVVEDSPDCFDGSPEHSFYDLGDNPAVPEVSGLNSIYTGDSEELEEVDEDYDYEFYGQFTPVLDGPTIDTEDGFGAVDYDVESPVPLDRSVFTEKEVAVLLLAHDVAQSSRRNSRRMAKYPDATPGPLVSPERASIINGLFEREGVMEIIGVIGAFQLLQRWTVCYPYRPGSLESPVRRFVQSPIGHDLCVRSVGQRSSSKSSAKLRTQQGRALRLPRHVLVSGV